MRNLPPKRPRHRLPDGLGHDVRRPPAHAPLDLRQGQQHQLRGARADGLPRAPDKASLPRARPADLDSQPPAPQAQVHVQRARDRDAALLPRARAVRPPGAQGEGPGVRVREPAQRAPRHDLLGGRLPPGRGQALSHDQVRVQLDGRGRELLVRDVEHVHQHLPGRPVGRRGQGHPAGGLVAQGRDDTGGEAEDPGRDRGRRHGLRAGGQEGRRRHRLGLLPAPQEELELGGQRPEEGGAQGRPAAQARQGQAAEREDRSGAQAAAPGENNRF